MANKLKNKIRFRNKTFSNDDKEIESDGLKQAKQKLVQVDTKKRRP